MIGGKEDLLLSADLQFEVIGVKSLLGYRSGPFRIINGGFPDPVDRDGNIYQKKNHTAESHDM